MKDTLPENFPGDLAATLAFGLLAILLVVVGYKLFDLILTKIDFDEELKKGNLSMAIVIAAFIGGLCYVIGQVVSSVVSG
ncbi:MAG: DUF350 domain-containing protein [Verrucomicrobiota bacterium]